MKFKKYLACFFILILLNSICPMEVLAKSYNVDFLYRKNMYKVHDKKNKYGIVTKSGIVVIPVEYSHLTFYDDYIFADKDGKRACFSQNGSVIIPLKYDKIIPNTQFLPVNIDNKWGIINYNDEIILPIEYPLLKTSGYNYIFQKEGQFVFLNQNNQFFYINEFNDMNFLNLGKNLFVVEKNQKKGVYDIKQKKIVIPLIYDDVQYLHDNLITVKNKDRYGIYKTDGQVLFHTVLKNILMNHWTTHFIVQKENNLYDLYNFSDLKKIFSDMEEVGDVISNNEITHIKAKKNGFWALEEYNNKTGKIRNILPYINEEILHDSIIREYCLAKTNSKWASYSTKTGEKLIQFDNDFIGKEPYFTGYILYLNGDKVLYDINTNEYKDFKQIKAKSNDGAIAFAIFGVVLKVVWWSSITIDKIVNRKEYKRNAIPKKIKVL